MADKLTYDRLKRLGDVVVASVGLVVTLPLQAALAGAVWAAHGRPVLFRQPRPGKDERIFELVKFRSMRQPDKEHVTDAQRLTRFGRLLRATSLDELPSLWNVVKGEMSLVGPRPLRTHYLPLYNSGQARRHEVRPGITGLAQVRGRNLLAWEERFRLDVYYVDHLSFTLDLQILAETVALVLRRTGVSAEHSATANPFLGNASKHE